MGKVARYKKIKACDPFSKSSTKMKSGLFGFGGEAILDPRRKRSLKKQARRAKKKGILNVDKTGGFDAPPDSDEDDFNLADLDNIKTSKREKKLAKENLSLGFTSTASSISTSSSTKSENTDEKNSNKKNSTTSNLTYTIPQSEKEEQQMYRDLNVNPKSNDKLKQNAQKPNESVRQYKDRLHNETQMLIAKSKNPSKKNDSNKNVMISNDGGADDELVKGRAQRKKEYLKKKKLKKKKRSGNNIQGEDNDDYAIDNDDNDSSFVTITQQQIGLTEQAERPPEFTMLPRGSDKIKKRRMAQDKVEQAKERSIERLKSQVEASYALLKEKRKKARQS